MLLKYIVPQGLTCPPPRVIYMYISIIFKPLNPLGLSQICLAPIKRGNQYVYEKSSSHDQESRDAHIM